MPSFFSKPETAAAMEKSITALTAVMQVQIQTYEGMIREAIKPPREILVLDDIVRFNSETGRGQTCTDNMLALHIAIRNIGMTNIPDDFHIVFGAKEVGNKIFDKKLQGNIDKLKKAVSEGHLTQDPGAKFSDYIPYGGIHFASCRMEYWAFQGLRSHFTEFEEKMPAFLLFGNIAVPGVYTDATKEELFSDYMKKSFASESFSTPESVIQVAKLYALGAQIFTTGVVDIDAKKMGTLLELGYRLTNIDDGLYFVPEEKTLYRSARHVKDEKTTQFKGDEVLLFYQELCELFFTLDRAQCPEDVKKLGGALFLNADFFKVTKGEEKYIDGSDVGALPEFKELSLNSSVAWLARYWQIITNRDVMNDFLSTMLFADGVKIDFTERMFFGNAPDADWGVGQMPIGLTNMPDGLTPKPTTKNVTAYYYYGYELAKNTMAADNINVLEALGFEELNPCHTLLELEKYSATIPRGHVSKRAVLLIPSAIVERFIAPFFEKLAEHFQQQAVQVAEDKLVEEETAQLGKRCLSAAVDDMVVDETATKRGGSGGNDSPVPQRCLSD